MKHERQLKIGAMARACGVTPRALRLYQAEGILQPELVDNDSGYRGYSIIQSVKLDMITQLQSAGFTLREIAQIEEAKSVDFLQERACEHSAELERQIRELTLAKKVTDDLVAGCKRYQNRELCNRIILERLPERHILLFDAPTDDDPGIDGDTPENERWEWYQQHTKRQLIERGYPLALFRRVGCYVAQDCISPDMNLLYSQPFVFVDEAFGTAFEEAVIVPAGPNLVVYYDSCHTDDGDDLDKCRIPTLLAHAQEQGYTVAGPFLMENIFRYMRFFNADAQSYYRHCLPVQQI